MGSNDICEHGVHRTLCGQCGAEDPVPQAWDGRPKFPDIEVQLTGEDGNAFFVMGKVRNALRKGGATQEDIESFIAEAMSGDYDHLLQTAMRYVEVL